MPVFGGSEKSWRQTKVMMTRNLWLLRRTPGVIISGVLLPAVYIAVILVLQGILSPVPSSPQPLGEQDPALDFLAYSPSTNGEVSLVMGYAVNCSFCGFQNTTLMGFHSPEEFPRNLSGGLFVEFQNILPDGSLPPQLSINVRSPTTNSTMLIPTDASFSSSCREYNYTCESRRFWQSHFLALQVALVNGLTQLEGVSPVVNSLPQPQPIPEPAHEVVVPTLLILFVGGYTVLALIPIFSNLLVQLVTEKESRIKEGLFVMGLTNVPYFLGFMGSASLQSVLTTFLCTVIFVAGNVFAHTNFFLLWVLLFLFCLSAAGLAFMLSALFTSPKYAAFLASLMLGAGAGIFMGLFTQIRVAGGVAMWLMCLYSPFALSLALTYGKLLDASEQGFTFSTAGVEVSSHHFSVAAAILMLVLDIPLYFLMGIYLDKVVPDFRGPKRHPLFCFGMRFRESKNPSGETEAVSSMVEPLPVAVQDRVGVRVDSLYKVYPNGTKALRGVNLELVEGEIFGLMGHNGSGKTTLCSILSGQVFASSGKSTVFGFDTRNDFSHIRNQLGICPQHDMIFPLLTTKEHLDLFCAIKGGTEEEVEELLSNFELQGQRDVSAKDLSGGQKRRLNVCMALVGQSRIVILDEPTAGVDVKARQQMWDALRRHRAGRVIIVASHLLEEIDSLTDRKAILSQGAVRCVGTSLFLKNHFGVGYRVVVSLRGTEDSSNVSRSVLQVCPSAQMEVFSGTSKLSFTISNPEQIPALLEYLDQEPQGVESFALDVTTLEDVLVKLETIDRGGKVDAPPPPLPQLQSEECNPPSLKAQTIELTKLKWAQLSRTWWTTVGLYLIVLLFQGVGLYLASPAADGDNAPPVDPMVVFPPTILPNGECAPISNLTMGDQLQHTFCPTPILGNVSSYLSHQLAQLYPVPVAGLQVPENALLYNPIFNYVLPVYWGAYLNYELSVKEVGYSVTFSYQPFVGKAAGNSTNPTTTNNPSALSSTLLLIFPLTLAASAFTFDLAKDRTSGMRLQLRALGLDDWAFWFAFFCRDGALVASLIVTSLILVSALQIPGFSGPGLLSVFLLLLVGLPNYWIILYNISGLVASISSYLTLATGVSFIGLIHMLIVSLLYQSGNPSLSMALFYGLLPFNPIPAMPCLYFIAELPGATNVGDYFTLTNVVWITLLVTCVQLVLNLFLLLRGFPSVSCCSPKVAPPSSVDQEGEDEDVVAERHNLETGSQSVVLSVEGLTKVFTSWWNRRKAPKVAVRDLWFGVQQGESFGLLGPNGCGKSVTIKCLTGSMRPTIGIVQVNGHGVASHESHVGLRSLGYCPQHDVLFDELTCVEHFRLVCVIKGVSNPEARVQLAIDAVGLRDHVDKQIRQMSGGTKRKVSFAMSVLGSPLVCVLDEPSTGMDSSSRKFAWDMIRVNCAGRALLLTTHNMEEADTLCSRIGIMVKGSLAAVGTASGLKRKYGIGYRLQLKHGDNQDEVKGFLSCHFPNYEILNEFEGNMELKVPIPPKVGETFRVLLNAKGDVIEDFVMGQVTLEQVFSLIVDEKTTQTDSPAFGV